MIRRREFIAGIGGLAFADGVADAQAQDRVRRIGMIDPNAPNDPRLASYIDTILKGLRELGWRDGSIAFDVRATAGDPVRIAKAATDLVALNVDLIIAITPASVLAVKHETHIPVLFTSIPDPVALGVAKTMAKPGGNFTGFTSFEVSMGSKWCELLKKLAPRITGVAALYGPPAQAPTAPAYVGAMKTAMPSIMREVREISVQNEEELARAVENIGRDPALALIAVPDNFLYVKRKLLIEVTAHHRVPALYYASDFVQDGGLVSYGPDILDIARRAVVYIDRILRGAKPVDLPVQAPNKYDLVLNLKTATALGITVPPNFLVLADEVIE